VHGDQRASVSSEAVHVRVFVLMVVMCTHCRTCMGWHKQPIAAKEECLFALDLQQPWGGAGREGWRCVRVDGFPVQVCTSGGKWLETEEKRD
jgi:hypothetical protein